MSAVVTIIGNVTRDAELRYTSSGLSVGSFSVAVSERQRGPGGDWQEGEPSYYDVTCFRLLGESVAETVAKGDRVIVTGRLKQSRWEQDGNKRSKVEVIADDVAKSVLWAAKGDSPRSPSNTRSMSEEDPF
jgi:single-strand DNA-binding protein